MIGGAGEIHEGYDYDDDWQGEPHDEGYHRPDVVYDAVWQDWLRGPASSSSGSWASTAPWRSK